MPTQTSNIYLDNTRLVSGYATCPRLYYHRHIRNWVPSTTRTPLVFGGAMHKALSVIWAGAKDPMPDQDLINLASVAFLLEWLERGGPSIDELPQLTDIRTPALADEILAAYVKQYRHELKWIELLGDETPYAVPLGDYNDHSVFYVGRFDKVYRGTDLKVWIGEHKTSSMYASNGVFRSTWINSFSPNNQVLGYAYAGYLTYGEAFQGVNIDGILVHKSHRGFKRIPIMHRFEGLDSWLVEIKTWTAQLLDSIDDYNNGRSPLEAFPRNLSSCHHYAGCAYLDICKFLQSNPDEITEDPPGFQTEVWQPFDESELETATKKGVTSET